MLTRLIKKMWVLRRRKVKNLICPWCQRPIKPGSKVTCYSLYKEKDLKNFLVPRVKVIYFKGKPVFIGCARQDCLANRHELVVAGIYRKDGKLDIDLERNIRFLIFS